MTSQFVDATGRLLNHVELVYRPGERKLVTKVFETLGCVVVETGGPFLVIQIQPGEQSFLHNVLYASEVTPAQWEFERVLLEQTETDGKLAAAYREFDALRRREPQRTTHFGIRLESVEALEQLLARIRSLPDPELEGRLQLAAVFRPGDPGALSDSLIQAFVRTDVCAAGLIRLGQHIELQVEIATH